MKIKTIIRWFDRDYWQMREALGYPMPYWVQKKWPGQFSDGGTNPYVCGICDAAKKYPRLHAAKLITMAERDPASMRYHPLEPLSDDAKLAIASALPLSAADFESRP